MRASSVALDPERPEVVDVGRLRFEAGFVLTSSDRRFGGFSGLWLAGDGARMLAASDHGTLWAAELAHDEQGRLEGFGRWRVITPARHPDDPKERQPNMEALAGDGRGSLVVAFEGDHRLRRYARRDFGATPEALPVPGPLETPGNEGIEALVSLGDGALLALSEGVRDDRGRLLGWRMQGDVIEPLHYVATPGFAPTGADRLGETIFAVERRFSLLGGFRARIVAFPAAGVRPGARLETEELARLGHPLVTDNFEAIAARRGPDGRVLLYVLSDDNFMVLQRTLLLQFSLARSGAGPGAGDGIRPPHERAEGEEQR